MKKIVSILLAILLISSLFVGCNKDDKVITVGASVTPHAEILKIVVDNLKEKGYTLEIKEFNDYIIPNTSTQDGTLLANYFQHQPYLTDFNANNNTTLVSVASIHYEPFGIYSDKIEAVSEIKKGDVIAIPNDGSNEARALFLLEAQGLIKLKDGVGFTATVLDIAENPLELDIREIEAAQLPATLPDVACAVINGNYAIGAGLSASKDAIAIEDPSSDSATTYGNILVVKEGNENDPRVLALIEALKSDEVREYINNTYDGGVVPLF